MTNVSLDSLHPFLEKITDFSDLDFMEQIVVFSYYTLYVLKDPLVGIEDIEDCYSVLNITPPINVNKRMTQLEDKGQLIKQKSHWVLSIASKDQIEDLIDSNAKSSPKKSIRNNSKNTDSTITGEDVFIVHGHDNEAKQEVARFIEKLDLNAIILHEQPNKGRTVIEKLVEESNTAGFAIILLTPDDIGYVKGEKQQEEFRSRQNVVLELGYFVGKIGRGKICILLKGSTTIPSDFNGVLYIPMDDLGRWKLDLAKELSESGFQVDFGKIS